MKRAVAIAIVAACFAAARAQAAPAENAAAKAAFVEGDRNFQLGKFDAAIDAYERAFGLDPQPAFLFNIALAHRRQYEIDGQIEHLARARELYRNYLKLEPHGTNRAGIEKLIAELTAKIEQARTRPEPPAAPAPAAPIAPLAPAPPTTGEAIAPGASPLAEKPAPAADHPAATLSAQAGEAASAGGSNRKWIIGGTIAAVVIVAAIAIFFATRSEASFDGPGVNLTPNMR